MHLAPRRLTQGSSGPYNTPVGEVTQDGGFRVAVLVCGNGNSYYKPVLGLLDEIALFRETQTVPAILAMSGRSETSYAESCGCQTEHCTSATTNLTGL